MKRSEAFAVLRIDSSSTREDIEEKFRTLLLSSSEQEQKQLFLALEALLSSRQSETESHRDSEDNTDCSFKPNDMSSLRCGQVLLNRYTVGDLIGTGGMGQVYICFDRVRQERIAIKRLHPNLASCKDSCERFRVEARISCNLAHPGIVRVYDVHDDQGIIFLTMELLKGRNLRNEIICRVSQGQPFSVDEVRNWGTQLSEALEHAHGQMVHRDIKPENIWLCDNGKVKLMDFGIAKLLNTSQLTNTGMKLGTLHYMSPEQLLGGQVDATADQYALAATLYELLTGKPPKGAFKSPKCWRSDISGGLSDAVMRGLNPDKSGRFHSVQDFSKALSKNAEAKTDWRLVAVITLFSLTAFLPMTAMCFNYMYSKYRENKGESNATVTEVEHRQNNSPKEGSSPLIAHEQGAYPSNLAPSMSEDKRNPIDEQNNGIGDESNSTQDSHGEAQNSDIALSSPPATSDADSDIDTSPTKPADNTLNTNLTENLESQFTNSFGMTFVLIHEGSFVEKSEEEEVKTVTDLEHTVILPRPFYLASHEVTVSQYKRFVDANPYKSLEEEADQWRNPGFQQTGNHPVVNISFEEAQQFCDWLSENDRREYRLPTYLEWELACLLNMRANTPDYTHYDRPSQTEPIGTFGVGRSGIWDLQGPVFEWISDKPQDDPSKIVLIKTADESSAFRVLQSRTIGDAGYCLPAENERGKIFYLNGWVGFRLAFSPSE